MNLKAWIIALVYLAFIAPQCKKGSNKEQGYVPGTGRPAVLIQTGSGRSQVEDAAVWMAGAPSEEQPAATASCQGAPGLITDDGVISAVGVDNAIQFDATIPAKSVQFVQMNLL